MEPTMLLVSASLILLAFCWLLRSEPRLPPFPRRPLPFVGHMLFLEPDIRALFKRWRKQCGDLFSFYTAGNLVVVLNGYDLIKEALVNNAEVFSDRPTIFFDQATGIPDKGLITSSGDYWREQRAVSVAILRKFGMGKNILAEKILEEVASFKEYLSSLKGKPTIILVMINVCVSNVICSILFGNRFEYDNAEFQQLMRAINTLASNQQNTSVINFMPWLRHLPGDLFKAKKLVLNSQTLVKALKKLIDAKRSECTDSEDCRNFVEAYISERNKKLEAGASTFLDDDDSLLKSVLHLFEAGTETTSTTINWCILYILNNPKIQDKVYQEIRSNVGTERIPTLQDKVKLIYLNAVIMETQRLSNIAALAVPHTCREDTTLRGYTIPKGCSIMPNLDSVLHDKKIWGSDAMSFRPERFIDNNGKLKHPEEFIPFGIGPRVCLGEGVAKMELFLFLASMFQKFEFLPLDPSHPPPAEYTFSIVVQPKQFEVRIVERK